MNRFTRLVFAVTAAFAVSLVACTSTSQDDERLEALAAAQSDGSASVEDYAFVRCKLPGRIMQLGRGAVFQAPRQPEMLTRSECAIRGGEFVLFDRSDYSAALGDLLPKARAGNPVAQAYVGEIYEKGLGLPSPDPSEAASWYRKAAQQGNVDAQVALGSLYERGLGVPRSKAEALNWYRKASGISEDPLQFSSEFATERKQLRGEIAKRQRVIAQLKARPSPSAKRQLVSQARDASSRAEELRKRADGYSQLQRDKSALEKELQQYKKLELAYREDSDQLFETARIASVQ